MKKEDHRSRVTKLMIRNAFTQLVIKKPIETISIKELCELAGINRGTFYHHYQDIYQLLETIEDEMISELQKNLSTVLSLSNLTSYNLFYNIFKFLDENNDMCVILLSENGDKKFLKKLLQVGKEMCLELYLKTFKNVSNEKIETFYSFVSAGCVSLVARKIITKKPSSVDELARNCQMLFTYAINYLK